MKKFKFFCFIFALFHVVTAIGLTLQIRITGVSDKPLENVTSRLNYLQSTVAASLTPVSLQTFYQQAPKNIQQALEPFGYFHSRVSSQLKRDHDIVTTAFHIIPGSVTKVTAVTITLEGPGQADPVLLKVLQRAKHLLAVNTALNTVAYEKMKQAFYNHAETEGYLKGYFSKHTIMVNPIANTAIIELTFNTGPQYYFGAVYFSKTPMAASFLERYLPFKYGEPFSAKKLMSLQTNLAGSIYFDQVSVTPKMNSAKNYHIPVDVNLVPAKAKKYSFGAGYGTDTGLRGSLGWELRRVTATGHYFQTLLQVSEKQNNNFQARYVIPGKNPVNDYWALTAGLYTDKPGQNNRYTTEQIGVNYVKCIEQWQRMLSLQLQHENFRVNNVSSQADTLLPSISWEKVSASNRLRVNNGYRIYFHFQGGAVVSQFNASFLQGEFQGKYIHSFNNQNNRLILNTDIGATAVQNFNGMPLSQRYFAGGTQSLRGYGYQDLGPGRYLAVGGVELQQRICGEFYLAAFYNAGNAVADFPLSLSQAAGIGVLYRSVIGPIEVTVAHPFNQPFQINQRGLMVQFSMGPDL